jgi:D-galactarolactone cycloisomerase
MTHIAALHVHVLRAGLGAQAFWSSQGRFAERKALLVEVVDSDGRVGWGEGGQYGPAAPVAACLRDVIAPQVVGMAAEPRPVWHAVYARLRDFARSGPAIEALSALDIALFDLWGQRTGQSVAQLLGGAFRDRVAAYATGLYYRRDDHTDTAGLLDDARAEADAYVAAGFPAVKMKIGLLEPHRDLARVAAVRERLGPDRPLFVDANHAYLPHQAVQVGLGLAAHGVGWFEEPVIPEDLAGYRRVATAIPVPVAGGECVHTEFGFADLIRHGGIAIAQPDLACCGGFTATQRIHALCRVSGVQLVPHVWGSGVALAAGLHLLASLEPDPAQARPVPGFGAPLIEYDRNPNPLRDELLTAPIAWRDGHLVVPAGAGLGITVDRVALARFAA